MSYLVKRLISSIFIFNILFFSTSSFGQRLKINVALGASAYVGDLQSEPGFLIQPKAAFTLGTSYDLNQFIRARVDLSIMGAKGDDKLSQILDNRKRNLNFKTTIWELALLGEYDLLNLILQKQTAFTPYVFGGPGVFHFNPTTIDRNGNKVWLHNIGTEGQLLGNESYSYRNYRLTQLNLQLGIGFRYIINDQITLGFEASYRKIDTDYLDDVHAIPYVNPSEFLAKGQVEAAQLAFRGDEIGYTFSDVSSHGRGTGNNKDYYYSFQLKATIRLDNIHIGKDLDYYFLPRDRAIRSQRNPPRL